MKSWAITRAYYEGELTQNRRVWQSSAGMNRSGNQIPIPTVSLPAHQHGTRRIQPCDLLLFLETVMLILS